jgi:alkylhydroperoxidase family enzyme
MPRIPYPDLDKAPPAQKAAIASAPINIVRMMAGASPAVFGGFNKFSGAFYGASSLSPDLRETAILRVGYLSNAKYETFQHEPSARLAGLTDAQIEAIRHGGEHPDTLSATQQAIVNFTDDVLKNVHPSDASLAALRTHLSDVQVLDLTLLIGLYMMVCRFLETTGVEVDHAALDWKKLQKPQ